MKKLIPAYVLSFVACFMLFLYEPILMYANNIDDFWFDFNVLMTSILPLFLICSVSLTFIYTLLYYFNEYVIKKKNFFEIIVVISYICFFATYIQGNYLSGNLPSLDGTKIDWGSYFIDNIITLIIWLIIIVSFVLLIKKYRFDKVIKNSCYISICIFFMLLVALIPSFISNDVLVDKVSYDVTLENINEASTDKNFIIFLVDAVDSKTFNDVLLSSNYKNVFDDFTYYPDTLSAYPFTRDSIPFILTGIWNENKTSFLDYYKDAINNSKLFSRLKEDKYDLNIYERESINSVDTDWNFSNFEESSDSDKSLCIIKQEAKYIMYKYLPYFAKKYSKIDELDFSYCIYQSKSDIFSWNNKEFYNEVVENEIELNDDLHFKFIHLEGGHVPFDLDENLNTIDSNDGTYKDKLLATLKVINAYLDRLKKYDVYDNSVIIVLADHGFSDDGVLEKRMNPILYIKGIDEHHGMYVSSKPISYDDLMDAYMDLLDGEKSNDLFEDIDYNRKRKAIIYSYGKEDNMREYISSGKAEEVDKMTTTGREFNR